MSSSMSLSHNHETRRLNRTQKIKYSKALRYLIMLTRNQIGKSTNTRKKDTQKYKLRK